MTDITEWPFGLHCTKKDVCFFFLSSLDRFHIIKRRKTEFGPMKYNDGRLIDLRPGTRLG